MTGVAGNDRDLGHDDEGPLKSKKSINRSYLRFTNKTSHHVDIVWLNYEGSRVKYKTLLPDQFVDINTFAGHPWVFFDADTGDRMVVQLKEVYDPVAWTLDRDGWPPQRKNVYITLPLYSLQDCCLQALRGLVPRTHVDQLDIAEHLKHDLHRLYRNKTFRRQNALVT